MKLRCDLCQGVLQMRTGGQGAQCTVCGLTHSMERLREKLGIPAVTTEIPAPIQSQVFCTLTDKPPVVLSNSTEAFCPRQFILRCTPGEGDLHGMVQQGGIGLGDQVYINNDFQHPYTVYSINDDPAMSSLKAGTQGSLYLTTCPRKVLREAQVVTGAPNPMPNAYNYPDNVWKYFRHLLEVEFGKYEVQTNVTWPGLNLPVTFLLCQNNRAVNAIFLIDSQDSKARYQVQKAATLLHSAGVGCTHFFASYRNDWDYAVNRIQDSMG